MTQNDIAVLRDQVEALAADNAENKEFVQFMSQVHAALEYAWWYLGLTWIQNKSERTVVGP